MSPPSVPTGLMASAGNGSVTLSWNSATGATGYDILQWNSTDSSWEVLLSSSYALGSSGRQATISNLTNGQTHYFRVREYQFGIPIRME